MVNHRVILTKEGFKKIADELENVRTVKVPDVEFRIRKCEEYGENVYLEDARAELAFYEKRIGVLDNMLRTAKLV